MTGNGGQRGRNGRPSRPSSRLAVGPEDAWRSWSLLPTDEAAGGEVDPESGGEPTDDLEQLAARLGGSMMIVGTTGGDPSAPTADSVATPAPFEATTPSVAREPRPSGAAGPVRAASPLPQRPKPDLPPPAPAVAPPAPASGPAAPDPGASPADGDAALVAGMSSYEASYEAASTREAPPQGNPPAAPGAPRPVGPVVPRRDDDVALVLVSDPDIEAAGPARRRPATPAKPRKSAGRPHPSTPSWAASTDAPRSISGLVAEAVGLLEERVAKQAEETEALLLELDARHTEELARLDGRVLRELKGIERGIPKSFEDRIHASFMQVVERLERLERRSSAAPATSAPPIGSAPSVIGDGLSPGFTAGLDAAIAYVMEQHGFLAGTVEDVAGRQAGLVEEHRALVSEHQVLAEQNIALAEAQQLVVAGQQRVNEELESALHRITELTQQISGLSGTLPEVERRVVGLEGQVGESLALLRAHVADLSERFPAVEGAVEVAQRNADALVDLRGTVEQFRAAFDHDVSQVRDRLGEIDVLRGHVSSVQQQAERVAAEFGEAVGRLDGLDERVGQAAASCEALQTDFLRLQAEADRRSSVTEARVLDLEDVIGGEVGVERNLLLDRIEEVERGLYDLDPDQFVRRDEVPGTTHQPDGPSDSGPGR